MASLRLRKLRFVPLFLVPLLAGGAAQRAQEVCGPFSDVAPSLCPFVAELFYTGITAGTSPTTFSPDSPMTRGQAAVFVAKGLDQALARGSLRAALGKWWTATPRWDTGLGTTAVGDFPARPQSDGADIWVPNFLDDTVSRVRGSDGKLLETWTGAQAPMAACIALGRVFVTGATIPGKLYMIDPASAPRNVTIVSNELGDSPGSIAFDGARFWTANSGGVSPAARKRPAAGPAPTPSISIVTPGSWSVQTVTAGISVPSGLVFDGNSMWTADLNTGTLLRLDSSGSVAQTVPVGSGPGHPVFDGANIWVPNRNSPSISVVRASTGSVVATLTGNGLDAPDAAAFDGRRIMVTSFHPGRVSLWNAQSLAPIANFPATDLGPAGACSDGTDFWITLAIVDRLARF